MHLASGTLANQVCTATAAISAASVVYALSRLRSQATPQRLLRVGMGALVVFIAQMVDVPLFGSVGVHLIGAAFLTMLAGPVLALLGMATVIVIQAFALNDGGVTTLGANVLNMAVVGVGVSALALHVVRARVAGTPGILAAAALASVASVMAAVSTMSIELALSGTPALDAFGLTMPAHASFAAWETTGTLVLAMLAVRLRALDVPVRVVK